MSDYRENFESIIRDLSLPANPSLYIHAPARLDPSMAPQGQDTLIAIVPVGHISNNGEQDWAELRDTARAHVFRRLSSLGITDLESHIKFETTFTPLSWRKRYNLVKGSTHGLCHNLMHPSRKNGEYWGSVHLQTIYNALSRLNAVLGGNLKSSWLGGHLVTFYKFKSGGKYDGQTHGAAYIDFNLADPFPHHLIFHEMGHVLNNAQGQRYVNSLNTTVVKTETGERVMGGTPYDRIEGAGYISRNDVPDPCVSKVDAELHPRSRFADGNTAGEEWGDLFANYVSGNFNSLPEGQAKYRWVHRQLFGS